mmetsp:Transcript_21299/g.59953  ORF Transcript_21299/g.59953 Transcript_21299/m.59953 type:complete len:244 (+) Transcript_21299:645-1376(+)
MLWRHRAEAHRRPPDLRHQPRRAGEGDTQGEPERVGPRPGEVPADLPPPDGAVDARGQRGGEGGRRAGAEDLLRGLLHAERQRGDPLPDRARRAPELPRLQADGARGPAAPLRGEGARQELQVPPGDGGERRQQGLRRAGPRRLPHLRHVLGRPGGLEVQGLQQREPEGEDRLRGQYLLGSPGLVLTPTPGRCEFLFPGRHGACSRSARQLLPRVAGRHGPCCLLFVSAHSSGTARPGAGANL